MLALLLPVVKVAVAAKLLVMVPDPLISPAVKFLPFISSVPAELVTEFVATRLLVTSCNVPAPLWVIL